MTHFLFVNDLFEHGGKGFGKRLFGLGKGSGGHEKTWLIPCCHGGLVKNKNRKALCIASNERDTKTGLSAILTTF
jgi:hypothetical protein